MMSQTYAAADEAPRAVRRAVFLRASIRPAASLEASEHRVRNVSATGACVEHDGALSAGTDVVVAMGTLGEIRGSIMWSRGRLAGLRFDGIVDLEAARTPRGTAPPPKAGWMADLSNAYRR